ncbi:MAG: ABC transporter permease [Acidobacteria bacterium]|nr:ABC transporter permease [Acidobacteriota bacterium]
MFQRQRQEMELADEMASTLQMHIDDNLRSGMSREEARYAALRSFGGVDQAKEECRDARGIAFLESLWRDLRFGIRLLRKSTGFTVVAVLSLALGIGASTAIFSIVNAVLLKPLPFKDPDRLVMISHKWPTISLGAISAPTFTMYRDQTRSFEALAVLDGWSANLTGRGEPERISGYKVSADFYAVLGLAPALGRTFAFEEDRPGANYVVVLSDGLWKRHFGSDPNIIDQTIMLDGISYQVIGVMPPRFAFPRSVEFWTPIAFTPDELTDEQAGKGYLTAIARLRLGTSIEQAQAEMDAIVPRVEQRFPTEYSSTNLGWSIRVSSLGEVLVGQVRSGLLIIFGLVGLVMLIACANVANLLLARATARQKEIAIRMSIGSGRGRLVRQLLTESALLGFLGGCSGVLVAATAIKLIVTAAPADVTRFLPNWGEIGMDATVLIFTIGLCVSTVVIFGLASALHASKSDVNEALKEEGRGSTSTAGRNRLRSFLVTSEVALAVVLLVASGLLIRSFLHVVNVDPGFRPQNLLTMSLSLPTAKYAGPQEMASFWDRLVRHIDTVPGVESAGMVSRLPLRFGDSTGAFYIEGLVEPGTLSNLPRAAYRYVTPDYFRAMGIRLLQGRFFTHRDTADSTPVAIIDELIARRYWPEGDAIGKRMANNPVLEGSYGHAHWREIVGIVGHVKHSGLDANSEKQLYIPSLQFLNPRFPQRSESFVVRTSSDPMNMLASIQKAIHALDSDLPVYRPMTMEQVVSNSLAQRRLSMLLVGLFAGIALLLTVIGIYGVVSYAVNQRTHEMGIRSALGATPGEILRLVVGEGLKLAVLGVAIGLVASLSITRFISSLLYGINTTDVVTYVSVALLLITIAVLASYVPARRATRVDPMLALRTE